MEGLTSAYQAGRFITIQTLKTSKKSSLIAGFFHKFVEFMFVILPMSLWQSIQQHFRNGHGKILY